MNKILTKYDIHIHGLDEKRYTFEFEGSDKFFEAFEQSFVQNGNFKAVVNLNKNATLIQLDFKITGEVALVCDRSLENFNESLDITEKFIYKYGDRREEISDEIEMIPFGTATINIAQHIYDFIGISLPMKRLHPRFRNDDFDEEGLLIYSSDNKVDEEEKEPEIDPRWAALSKLKTP